MIVQNPKQRNLLVKHSKKDGIDMIEFVTSYWSAVIPTAVTGMVLLGILKKARDEKERNKKAPATIEVKRKK